MIQNHRGNAIAALFYLIAGLISGGFVVYYQIVGNTEALTFVGALGIRVTRIERAASDRRPGGSHR